jgi:predicted RNA-binding protein YlxR (DUF448 family)
MLAIADPADLDDGPRTKPGTARMCALTRQVAPVDDLIRFVVSPAGEVVADLKRRLPGRGLWVSLSRGAVAEAARRNIFARGFRRAVQVSPALADEVERLMARGLTDALAMAAKAGQVVAGFAKVEEAITGGQVAALLHASDGAADGIRKLDARLSAAMRENGAIPADLPVIRALTGAELDLALGRTNVVHAALLAGPAGRTFLARWRTLDRFRASGSSSETGNDI